MVEINANELLKRLEESSRKAQEHNRKQDEINGTKKAWIKNILQNVEALKDLGIDAGLELKSETEFTAESVEKFRKVAQDFLSEKEKEADRLDEFFKAVEEGDTAKIKEITGEDVDSVDYDVTITSVEDTKQLVAETNEAILEEGVSSISKEDVLDVTGSDDVEEEDDVEVEVELDESDDEAEVELDESDDDDEIETEEEVEDESTEDTDSDEDDDWMSDWDFS